ncbi:ATP synthase F1 subunit epsilon [Campylobacter peloridis]|uniref:ATP synthase epsilon chain n=1 Tax=Campylobacter peloridis TaxID=488546 RepID=A0A5C7E275_9BACT|nr:ATP synthase F1 subunit epsilon [Campylobacter peloridis]AJC84068.1 ATP synthase, F1 complex, epsilon subunit [Campylobacter peloridis LMG 23910]MBX1886832.1 F0F1 ATP synthase subunit epsilon [Campylobacter peloridis]MBX2077957.1 F0F1 ATP synthase subunit epsilon [Campylobacter peloridis]QOQ89657.1 F0F1 ATP synthase subunit epsilon [Campylobacter peloridis]TXE84438.1 F0F1 ATP synthase subunit epsilon [Campylobacter peloridis]
MQDLISLEIITPLGMIYQGNVKLVVLPGSEGEFGVLKGHASLISSLKTGIIDIEKEDSSHELIAVDSGHVKVSETKVSVLAKGAVWVGGNSDSEIAQKLEEAKELIKSMSSDNAVLASTFAKLDNNARQR